MTQINRSLSWTFPALFCSFLLFSAFILSGCNSGGAGSGGSGGETAVNEDSVKPHIMPIGVAMQYTSNFRSCMDSCSKRWPGFKDSLNFGHAEAFNSDVINLLLKQKNAKGEPAVGVRIYYGRDNANGMIKMILVPYDKNNNDIINVLVDMANKTTGVSPAHTEALKVGSDGQTIEQGQHCPTICDDGGSGLNGGQ
jgi:hypothetical protein